MLYNNDKKGELVKNMTSFFSEDENPDNLNSLQKKQKNSQQKQKRKTPLPPKNDDDMNWNRILKIIL
jgi:hypothetical protein